MGDADRDGSNPDVFHYSISEKSERGIILIRLVFYGSTQTLDLPPSRRRSATKHLTVYKNKAIALKKLGDNQATVGLYDRAIEILERLVNVEGRRELANDIASLYQNKAIAVKNLETNGAAVDSV